MYEEILNKLTQIENQLKELTNNYNEAPEKATIKNIDILGRVTVPKSIRKKYEIEDGGAAKVYEQNGKIIMEILK